MSRILFLLFLLCSAVTVSAQEHLAAPDEVTLNGNIRRETISSPVGKIELRWPRKVEVLFGRSPLRAAVDTANTLSRAIRKAGFPTRVEKFQPDWKIVFLDEELPETQIPKSLISNCHPGWMTPPANIYIVGQRVAAGCEAGAKSTTSVADKELARVMIHEFAHALEFKLIEGQLPQERFRAEGFATWFEVYAANSSSLLNRGELYDYQRRLAEYAIEKEPGPFKFSGSPFDYARSGFFFHTIENRLGVRALMDVYEDLAQGKGDFLSAVAKRTSWSEEQLNREMLKLIVDKKSDGRLSN